MVRWGGNYYYLDSNGIMAEGWKLIQGKWHYMEPVAGIMATGWISLGDKRYYLDTNNGAMVTGMIQDGTGWYWLNATGEMDTGWKSIGADKYYFNPNSGKMVTGWAEMGGSWYYFNPDSGIMATGWLKSGESWYYFNSNGAMAYNTTINGHYLGYNGAWQSSREVRWHYNNGLWYYLDPEGGYEKGWITDNSRWYYMNPVTGEMLTGWAFDNGKWYFLYDDGSLAYNTTIDGYILGTDGAWQTNAAPEDYMITIGSTDQDVLSVMQEPTNIGIGSPLVKYYYNNSIIYLLDDGEEITVIGWDDKDNNLMVTTGGVTGSTFGLGSSVAEVEQAMGTPAVYDTYYYLGDGTGTYFGYADGSKVSFDSSLKVNGWINKGSLKINTGGKDAAASSIKTGSSIYEAFKVMGTPTSIEPDADTKIPCRLYFGETCILLGRDETVTGWLNKDIYDINLGARDPSASPVKKGTAFEDVIRAMGTPDEVIPCSSNDRPYMLKYGVSYIYMNETTGMVEKWTNNGDLNVVSNVN